MLLNSGFFNRKEVKKIRGLVNGDKLTVIYLKLLIKTNYGTNTILFDGTEIDICEQLSLEIDEEYQCIRALLTFLMKENLITTSINGDINIIYTDKIRDRHSTSYKNWRKNVFERDNYTCKCCNISGGKLEAHHIKPWSIFIDDRFDVKNGITLCKECHKNIHK